MLHRDAIKQWMQKEVRLQDLSILAGFSGGSDSAVLCHILAELREELGFSLELIYIQHNLRDEESRQEEIFVKDWAAKYSCPLTVVSVDVRAEAAKEKLSPETAARHLRHKAFRETADRLGCNKIALAHHAKDQAETVLMHFLRGSGIGGLAGMKKIDGRYLRPLLDYSKDEIENYLTTNYIAYCQDSSNQEMIYRRNRVRLELLPYLQTHFNPNLVQNLAESATQMQQLQDYLLPQIESAYQKAVRLPKDLAGKEAGTIMLAVPQIKEMPVFLQQMVIRRAIAECKGNVVDLERSHIKRAISLLEKDHGKREDLIAGWQVRKSYENLIFERKSEKEDKKPAKYREKQREFFSLGLDRTAGNRYIKIIKEFILIGRISEESTKPIRQNARTEEFDFTSLPKDLVFRYPQAEDYLVINAAGNTKKLKDYLADRKVPKERRNTVPVVAAGDEIIWAVGYRPGYPYRITESTRQFFRLTILGRTGTCRRLK